MPLDKCVIDAEREEEEEEEEEEDAPPPGQFHRTADGSIAGGPPPKPGELPPAPRSGPTDQLGRPLPDHLVAVFEKRPTVKSVNKLFGEALKELKRLDRDDAVGGFLKRCGHFEFYVGLISEFLRLRAAPFCVCPACEGDGDADRCPTCGGHGWIARAGYEQLDTACLEAANRWGGTPDDPAPPRAEWNGAEWAASGRDGLGNTIPPNLRDTFACDALVEALRQQKAIAALLDGARWLTFLKGEAHAAAAQMVRYIDDALPYAVCINCNGRKSGCEKCQMSGYHPKWKHEAGHNNTKREKKGGEA